MRTPMRTPTKHPMQPAAQVGAVAKRKRSFRPKAKKRLLWIAVYALLLGYGLYQIVFVQQAQLADLRAKQAQLNQSIEQETVKNEQLTQQYQEGNSDSVVERIAREKLGLVMPNEKMYMDASRN